MKPVPVFVRAVLALVAAVPCALHAQPNLSLSLQLYAELSVMGEVGKIYQVQYATELSDTNAWYALMHFELKWNPHKLVDTTRPATGQRFYRAVEVEVPTNVAPVQNMVFIPPGTFLMGSPTNEAERWIDETQHEVTISRGFWMGKYEVTQGEYLNVVGYNPSRFRNGNWWGVTNELEHPVEQVLFFDATNYCALLTERERAGGRLPEGYVYRLPTEAEWEYACRGGTTTSHHYGDELRSGMANFRGSIEYDASLGTLSNPAGIWLHRTAPVGTYRPNAWGLHDMHGNVFEWCQDWYGPYPAGGVTDPTGPGMGSLLVMRGSGWDGAGLDCRSAERHGVGPRAWLADLGFRVVLARSLP